MKPGGRMTHVSGWAAPGAWAGRHRGREEDIMANGSHVLLVAVDFEQVSLKALELAKELAPKLGSEVVLVHVYQLPIYTYPGLEPTLVPGFHTEVMAAARRALEELAVSAGGV